ncbi:extensin-like [Prosopis cineraria]|uniref:extensin-like n=1 Tax=Prosopis cineraria TaxID=364024 RepID=UPI00240F0DC1|nr:extensin-like [Prosopis cineraria]
MIIQTHPQIKIPVPMNLFLLVIICVVYTAPLLAAAVETRKLDDTTVPATPNSGQKCTPCDNNSPPPSPPYYPSPPPPPPSPPPPPPTYYYSPPPPKKTPPSQDCPPPPSSILYITGPPGNLYPVDENFNGASRRSFGSALPLLAGLLAVLALW